jgi:hypothetical protein
LEGIENIVEQVVEPTRAIEPEPSHTMPAGAVTPDPVTRTVQPATTDTPVPAAPDTPGTATLKAEKNWPGICHPSPKEAGARVADLNRGDTVELVGYLDVRIGGAHTINLIEIERLQ